jgi:hypothetical protein
MPIAEAPPGGEGCGVLILEQLEHALARGATIYAELLGFGATEDAFHLTAPAPDGKYAALAMQRAIADAELQPNDIDHISAHGTATPLGDVAETAAIHAAFGAHAPRLAIKWYQIDARAYCCCCWCISCHRSCQKYHAPSGATNHGVYHSRPTV